MYAVCMSSSVSSDGYVITWEQREQSLSSASAVYNQQRGHWWWEAGRRASDRRLDSISVSELQLHDIGFVWSFEDFSRATLETPRRLDSISARRKSIVHLLRALVIRTVAIQKFIQRSAGLGLQEQLCLTWCLNMPRIKCQTIPATTSNQRAKPTLQNAPPQQVSTLQVWSPKESPSQPLSNHLAMIPGII